MSDTALLVIDMMNAYRHPDAEKLTPNVEKIVDPLAGLISRARRRDDVDRVILTGQVTEQCILYSALDAYVRLKMMEQNMRAEILTADDSLD